MSADPSSTSVLGPLEVLALGGKIEAGATSAMLRQQDDYRWHNRFLRALLESDGDFDAAATKAKVSVYSVYAAEVRHPKFKADLLQVRAMLDARRADEIERETAKRAKNGTPYTRYSKEGEVLEEGTTPDTPAAALMLKALRPERFGDKKQDGSAEAFKSVADLFRIMANAAVDKQRAKDEAALQVGKTQKQIDYDAEMRDLRMIADGKLTPTEILGPDKKPTPLIRSGSTE